MVDIQHFTSVRFHNFKAFRKYSVSLKEFNVLVGPNNAGKSTIISAFRILSEGIRKALARKSEFLELPNQSTWGYRVSLIDLPVATENVFYNYDDKESAIVQFRLTNGNELKLCFPAINECYMTCSTTGKQVRSPADFKREFNVSLGFVPILGPVEHKEPLYQKEAARLALLTHRASRNFRNIWYHYPEGFEEFRSLIRTTWPGMDIEPPELDHTHDEPRLHMFCPEERFPREIFWAGFGFQVWCQMLTFIVKSGNTSLFIIDEPDIYLHSDLQRQLVNNLKMLGPDILIATHSTEIISEADPDDLLVVNKRFQSARRINDPSQLQIVFGVLGSNLNPTLTQLAKSKRAIFVEGKDFQLFSLFARKLGKDQVANRSDFAVIPVEGFNAQKVHDFSKGMELTLGTPIAKAIIFDRDYRSDEAVNEVLQDLKQISTFAVIHKCKEIENYLLCPCAVKRAIMRRIAERNKRTGGTIIFEEDVVLMLSNIAEPLKNTIRGQYLAKRVSYERAKHPNYDQATINTYVMTEFDKQWDDFTKRMMIVPGKQMLSLLNQHLQAKYQISITSSLIISSFNEREISRDIVDLIDQLDKFRKE